MTWTRVSAKHPCPVCHKPDWCCVTDGLTLCMRLESPTPSRGKAGGWLHKTGEASGPARFTPSREASHIPEVSVGKLLREWKSQTSSDAMRQFAESIGVKAKALESLGTVWCDGRSCWAFPMRDVHGKPIGIRLRTATRKVSVGGSKSGLFMADGILPRETVWLTEGPTDTAALMSIGARCVVGRSSLTSCWDDLKAVLAKWKAKRAILVVDDETTAERLEDAERVGPAAPGRVHSKRLAQALGMPCKFLLVPGCKDVREYVKQGGTMDGALSLLERQNWTVVK